MIVYYAHCMSLYGTPQEERDIATLRTGFVGMLHFTTHVVDLWSPELDHLQMQLEEDADLAWSGELMTGFELDLLERLRREFDRRLDELVLFGVS